MLTDFLLTCILFVTPFVIVPFLVLGFEPPKVMFFELILGLLIIAAIFRSKRNELSRAKTFIFIFLGIFGLTLLQIVLGKVDFMGNSFRFQGVLTLWCFLIWSVLSLMYKLKMNKAVLLAVLVLQTIVVLLIGPNAAGRWAGTLGEPNALAAFLVFISVFFVLEKNWWRWLVLVLIGALLVLTGSQSGVLSFALILFASFSIQKLHFSLSRIMVLSLIIITIALSIPFFHRESYSEERGEIWKTAVKAGMTHPFIGNGFGNVYQALRSSGSDKSLTIKDNFVDSSHNLLLDWWVQGGVLGLGLLLSLVYISFKHSIQSKSPFTFLLLLTTLTPLLFNPASIVGLIAFWWAIGQSLDLQNNLL